MKIYGDINSGNCYKLALLTSILSIEHEWIPMDILNGDTRTNDYLRINPLGKIPALELPDGRILLESNAILNFLAEGSILYSADPFTRAKIHEWQFYEQYSHEPHIAVSRFIIKYLKSPPERRQELESKQSGGNKALLFMDNQLAKTKFLVGHDFTVADISLFAYTHVAYEGGFDLEAFPNVKKWIGRIMQISGFIPMDTPSNKNIGSK